MEFTQRGCVTQGLAKLRPALRGGQGENTGVLVCSFNVNVSPETSHAVLECDSVISWSDTLTVL